MAKKIYAVRKGRKTGLFNSWEECKTQVDKFPDAQFKSFKNSADATAWLNNIEVKEQIHIKNECHTPRLAADEMVAYVDGSYDGQRYSFGAVLLAAEGIEEHASKAFDNPENLALRNVAGELEGARYAIGEALRRKMKKLTIVHDYTGIAHWYSGVWQANLPLTQAYRDFSREAADKITLSFIKVKSHSGDYYNELADRLAKDALQTDWH